MIKLLQDFSLNASFQGVNRILVLAFNNTTQNVAGNSINILLTEFKETVTENISSQE